MIKKVKTYLIANADKTISILLYAAAFFHLAVMLVSTLNTSIWYDESASLLKMKFSYGEIAELLANYDVHTPLYFFYLKTMIMALSWTSISVITIGKFASVLPIIIMVIVAATVIKKEYGSLCGALFALCITAMPRMFTLGTELRMYTLALLFVTLCFLFAAKTTKNPKNSNFICLTFFATLSLYTHYFAGLMAVVIYVILAVWFLKSDKKLLIKWLLSGIGVAVLFVPWIINLIKAVSNTHVYSWISKPSIMSIARFAIYPFHISGEDIASILLIIVFAFVGLRFLLQKSTENDGHIATKYFAVSGVSLYALVFAIGLFVSFVISPILTNKYLFPAIGCLWLGFCIALSGGKTIPTSNRKLTHNRSLIVIICFLCIIGFGNTIIGGYEEYKSSKNHQVVNTEVISQIGENDVIITDVINVLGVTSYLTPVQKAYIFPEWNRRDNEDGKLLINVLCENAEELSEISDLLTITEQYDKVWLLLTKAENIKKFQEFVAKNEINVEKSGTILQESININYILIEEKESIKSLNG